VDFLGATRGRPPRNFDLTPAQSGRPSPEERGKTRFAEEKAIIVRHYFDRVAWICDPSDFELA
jgi:hypothetical protein